MDGRKRKKKKSYYIPNKKHCNGRQFLEADLKGFLITCNKAEKDAVREAYNVLNEYADMLYGEEAKDVKCIDAETTELDFAKEIASQVDAEKASNKTSPRRFQAVDTKTSNCVFIRTTLEMPGDLLNKFMSDVAATGITKSRSILKIFPVDGTCKATEDKIEKLVEEILTKQFSNQSLGSYAIIYKVRCNSLGRDNILPLIGQVVRQTCPGSTVDLGNPDYVISIDILNKFCCVSIMKDFYKFKKYNVQEIGKSSLVAGNDAGRHGVQKKSDGDLSTESNKALKTEPDLDLSGSPTKSPVNSSSKEVTSVDTESSAAVSTQELAGITESVQSTE